MGTGFSLSAVTHHGNPRWKVDFTDAGSRVRRFFNSKAAAEEWIRKREQERDALGGIVSRWTALERALVAEAFRILQGSGASILDAAKFYLRNRQRFGALEAAPTFAAVAGEMIQAKEAAGKRPRYVKELRRSMRLLERTFSSVRVSQITPRQIENWLESVGKGWSPSSKRTRLVDLRTFFAFALRRGYVASNPAAVLELPKHTPGAPCIFSVESGRKLLETARETDPGLLPMLALGMFAGIRPDEIRRLVWAEIGPEFVEITARKAKTARRRLVSVTPALAAWLEVGGHQKNGLSLDTAGPWPVNHRKRMARLLEAAGIEWGQDICRHSFASYHLAAHRNAPATAHELGHANTQMLFAHYRELVRPEAAAEWWALRPAVRDASLNPPV